MALLTVSQSNEHELFSQPIYKLMIFNLIWQMRNRKEKEKQQNNNNNNNWCLQNSPFNLSSQSLHLSVRLVSPPSTSKIVPQIPCMAVLWQHLELHRLLNVVLPAWIGSNTHQWQQGRERHLAQSCTEDPHYRQALAIITNFSSKLSVLSKAIA